jgi:hypothetical protein
MQKTPESDRRSGEIDLLDLLLKSVTIIRDNFSLIVIFFVLGTALGATYFLTTKKQYESKMIISSNILTTSYAKILFDNVNGHLKDADYALLAKDLNINPEDVHEIAKLQIENLSKSDGDQLKDTERYLITARVYDQRILPALQKGLIDFLEHNEFVRIRVEQQKNSLTQMKAAVEKELDDMQQFKVEIASGKFFSGTRGNVMFDPTTVNTKILELTQKRIDIQNSLQLINSVQLIEGFTAFKHHMTPSLKVSIVTGSILGLISVVMLIVFKSIRRLLRMAEANETKNAA